MGVDMIYTVENTAKIGRQVRVKINGKPVHKCFYADTDKGIVRYYGKKSRASKRYPDQVVSFQRRGRVVVTDV